MLIVAFGHGRETKRGHDTGDKPLPSEGRHMDHLIIPAAYRSELGLHETQVAIKSIKDYFQRRLAERLNLLRVSAPLFVDPASGLNDNLNGVERPVSFDIPALGGAEGEVVQSLAKWKRYALGRYGFAVGEGLYTDMNAIRRDEETDNLHSIFVDQWDWEKVIAPEDRRLDVLVAHASRIYDVIRTCEGFMEQCYSYIKPILPPKPYVISTQELLDRYPSLDPKARELSIVRVKGAVILTRIGDVLSDGERHDGRAPDYDDWSLNCDIIVYYPVLDCALELSSMGIRVDAEALASQLAKAGCQDRAELPFQSAVLAGKLPQTIGGGIGQSRLCMFFLRKAHIGEVQSSLWPADVLARCTEAGITLL